MIYISVSFSPHLYILLCFNPFTFFHSLSYVTEQVAEHTNGTIGALLNATFGNAPELLIATAALRQGFYRVVQLAMLGSMLTNLLFVFGMACVVGGLRWQVQELRITSGNVSVGLLLLAVAGSLLPAGLVLGGQLRNTTTEDDNNRQQGQGQDDVPSKEELQFCRVNAFVMVILYGCYLIFQLGTHKEEFDEDENVVDSANGNQLHLSPHFTSRHGRQQNARKNKFCLRFLSRFMGGVAGIDSGGGGGPDYVRAPSASAAGGGGGGDVEMLSSRNFKDRNSDRSLNSDCVANGSGVGGGGDPSNISDDDDSDGEGHTLLPQNETVVSSRNGYFDEYEETDSFHRRHRSNSKSSSKSLSPNNTGKRTQKKEKTFQQLGHMLPLGLADPSEPPPRKFPFIHYLKN
jgi:Ca2+/Na+ antiporter